MSRKNPKIQLRMLRETKEVISPRSEWLASNRDILMMQIQNTAKRPEIVRGFSFVEIWKIIDVFIPNKMMASAMRPLAVLTAVAVVMGGGWIGTVSASYNSLPGETLYPVKIATETVQTALTTDKIEKVKLQTDLMVRRVDEVKKVASSNLSNKAKRIEVAVTHLKNESEQVKGGLDEMKTAYHPSTDLSVAEVVQVAKDVEKKTTDIQKTLDQTTSQMAAEQASSTISSAPLQDQVKQASAMVSETGVKAVEVIVEKHLEDKNSVSAEDVKNVVDNKLKALEDKMTNVEQQISTITATSTPTAASNAKDDKAAQDATQTLVAPAKESAEAAKDSINQTKQELAKDNFGGALDKLKQSNVLTQVAEVKTDAAKVLTAPITAAATSTLNLTESSTVMVNITVSSTAVTVTTTVK